MEKVIDEGYWTHSTVLDPSTYVSREDKRIINDWRAIGVKLRAFISLLVSWLRQ
jgi:hypothetical protein